MRISLLRISLMRFFKTFLINLANAIIVYLILLLRSFSIYVYFANAIIVFFILLLRIEEISQNLHLGPSIKAAALKVSFFQKDP